MLLIVVYLTRSGLVELSSLVVLGYFKWKNEGLFHTQPIVVRGWKRSLSCALTARGGKGLVRHLQIVVLKKIDLHYARRLASRVFGRSKYT